MQRIAKTDQLMGSSMLRVAYRCIFNCLANLEMGGKYKLIGGYVFVRLGFFFNNAKHFYMTERTL